MNKIEEKKENIFILFFFATILIERIILLLTSAQNWQWFDKMHHIYLGIGIVFILMLYNRKFGHHLIIPFAIGLGLIADEIIFLIPFFYKDGDKSDYFGIVSLIGTILIIILVLVLRKNILNYIKKINQPNKNK